MNDEKKKYDQNSPYVVVHNIEMRIEEQKKNIYECIRNTWERLPR